MPARVGADPGYRWYCEDQIERARLVVLLRRLDMPLEMIARVIELDRVPASAAICALLRPTRSSITRSLARAPSRRAWARSPTLRSDLLREGQQRQRRAATALPTGSRRPRRAREYDARGHSAPQRDRTRGGVRPPGPEGRVLARDAARLRRARALDQGARPRPCRPSAPAPDRRQRTVTHDTLVIDLSLPLR